MIFDIPNRGGKGVLSTFNRAKGSADPTTEEEFGDGLLMRQGYTVVAIGWEFDIPKKPGLVLLTAPVATDNGKVDQGLAPTLSRGSSPTRNRILTITLPGITRRLIRRSIRKIPSTA